MNILNILNNFDYYSYSKLLLISVIIGSTYYPLTKWLNRYPNFKQLKEEKKMYVSKNIVKSCILSYLSVIFNYQLYDLILGNHIDQYYFRNYGILYVGNDLAGLLFVRNLPSSTKLHHVSTLLLYTILCIFDINNNSICRMMCIYTIFSCYPFMVNLYLGLRYLKDKDIKLEKYDYNINTIIEITRKLSYNMYLISCSMNWGTHVYLFGNIIYNRQFTYLDLLYCGILIPIIEDDLILMNWLKYNK
jgi:hypothetical protein